MPLREEAISWGRASANLIHATAYLLFSILSFGEARASGYEAMDRGIPELVSRARIQLAICSAVIYGVTLSMMLSSKRQGGGRSNGGSILCNIGQLYSSSAGTIEATSKNRALSKLTARWRKLAGRRGDINWTMHGIGILIGAQVAVHAINGTRIMPVVFALFLISAVACALVPDARWTTWGWVVTIPQVILLMGGGVLVDHKGTDHLWTLVSYSLAYVTWAVATEGAYAGHRLRQFIHK